MENKKHSSECPVKENHLDSQDSCPVKEGARKEECPVKHKSPPASSSSMFSSIYNFFGGSQTVPPVAVSPLTSSAAAETVPSSSASQASTTDGYNTAANDLVFGHQPQPGQKVPMSSKRTVSTIPKSDFTPAHQPGDNENWVYPSQQQYYNAMKRKGYNPPEEDVAVVLQIHNIVNEKGWAQIKEWEALRGCTTPKLKQFEGRPQDISPKAYLMSLMGYSLPFDRHDWIVDSNGSEVRYVIDFYKGAPNPTAPIAMHLDVRPAVDNPYALYHRLKFNMFDVFDIPKVSSVAHIKMNPENEKK